MATMNNKKGATQKTLGTLLPYFIGMELTIEQKTGRLYTGTLSAADDAMNLTLDDVTLATHRGAGVPGSRRRSSKTSTPTTTTTTTTTTTANTTSTSTSTADTTVTPTFAIVHIRGSTIRYIHFPDKVDLAVVIKQGMDRERSVAQKYKRGVRR
jgi:small nuclear ribonucleoprotein (snRNP)-like protein